MVYFETTVSVILSKSMSTFFSIFIYLFINTLGTLKATVARRQTAA